IIAGRCSVFGFRFSARTPNTEHQTPNTHMDRPSWDEYFMMIARDVSTRATCERRSVGAVSVLDRRILTTGYNGAPRGLEHCVNRVVVWQPGSLMHGSCVLSDHAVLTAVIQASSARVSHTRTSTSSTF